MLKRLYLSLFCILIFWLSGSAFAKTQTSKVQDFVIHADQTFRDNENDIIELEGNVQIIFQTQHLSCNKAKINLRSKSIDALGEVFIVNPKANIGGDRVIINYETGVGVIYNGYVQSGNVMFEGSVIHKTGENNYISADAKYTTCTTCPEAWNFSGTKIRAELGGYAYIKNSVMRLGGVPIFWLPYFIVPLKSGRQSGLLNPTFDINNVEGVVIGQSYFWAISRSKDATITLQNYELRGLKPLLNYRYMLSEHSYGELDTAVIQDRLFSDDTRLVNRGVRRNRHFIKYNHYYDLPENFIQRTQLNTASDLQYPKDYPLETGNHGYPSMESRVSLTKNTFSNHYSLDSSYYINLLQSNPLAGNNDSVHRLPEIKVSQSQTKIGDSDFLFSLDVNYVNFARTSYGYDDLNTAYNPYSTNDRYIPAAGSSTNCSTSNWEKDPLCSINRDGQYNSTVDLIRSGQRLDLAPAISRPFQIGKFIDVMPKLSYRETQYYFPVDKNTQRRFLRAEVVTKTSFSRVFGDFSPQGERIKHDISPEFTVTKIPWIDQPKHPFFGATEGEIPYSNQRTISNSDLNSPFGIQFDFNDRVYDRNLLTFAITNRLTRKYWSNGQASYLQFFSWRIAQSFDAAQADNPSDNKQPWSDQSSELYLDTRYFDFSNQINNFPYQKVINSNSTIVMTNDWDDTISLTHSLTHDTTPGRAAIKTSEQYTLIAKKDLGHLNFIGQLVRGVFPEDKIKAWGYGLQIKFPGDCLFFNFYQYQNSNEKKSVGFNIIFNWDGEPNAKMNASLLQKFQLVN